MQPYQPDYDYQPAPQPVFLPQEVPVAATAYSRPTAPEEAVGRIAADDPELQEVRPHAGTLRKVVGWTLAILAAIVVAMSLLPGAPGVHDDAEHQNWARHVQPINDHNAERLAQSKSCQVRQVTALGGSKMVDAIVLAEADADAATTNRARAALIANDEAALVRVLATAQQLNEEELHPDAEKLVPQISSGMELIRGDARFFHIFLFDSCAVDGDAVEVLVNGVPLAVVPISHRGATLSVPVGQGTTVSLRGLRDGGGGITVACRTSLGDFFMQSMTPGEEQVLSLVR